MLNPIAKVSFVIPVLNEKENIGILLEKIGAVMAKTTGVQTFEVIVIDDGSTDGTVEHLARLKKIFPWLVILVFRRNFGKSAALMAGFAEASGEIVITMDGDLQDDPEEIPRFLQKIGEGFDLVSGWKEHRQDPREKVLASHVFNGIVSRITGVSLQDFNCGFKAYQSWCIKSVRLTGNFYRFLPAFVHMQGGKISEISVRHHPRIHGRSKYGPRRYFHGAFDLLTVLFVTKFFQRPLYFFAIIGVPVICGGLLISLWLVGAHIYYWVSGDIAYQLVNRPMLQIGITMIITGVQTLLFGLLGELVVSRTQQASYSIREKI